MGNDGVHICHFNQSIECENRNCTECGWNPSVSEKRLEDYLKKAGIKKKDTTVRVVNAIDVKLRIKRTCAPLAEKGYSAFGILVEVMKCIAAAKTLDVEAVTYCEECPHGKITVSRKQEEGFLRCTNAESPCNGRIVKTSDYCPYGGRKENEKEDD